MDDVNDSTEEPGDARHTAALAAVYLESLTARMPPEEYEALTTALHKFWHVMEEGGQGEFDMSESEFAEPVRKELMLVMAIVGTGRMDHRVVDLPGPAGGWAVVTEAVADDPEKLAELADRLADIWQEQEQDEETLRGIEQASQDPHEGGGGAAG
jgi:hypothetical protein